MVARWNDLFDQLLYKYLDGNVKDEFGKPQFEGYSEEFFRQLASATEDRYKMLKVPRGEGAGRGPDPGGQGAGPKSWPMPSSPFWKDEGSMSAPNSGSRSMESTIRKL